jgi:hypothetical protein
VKKSTGAVIPSEDSMILQLTTVHENSCFELTPLLSMKHSAIFIAARNLALSSVRKGKKTERDSSLRSE